MIRSFYIHVSRQEADSERVDLRRSPDETTVLASMGVVRKLGERAFVDVPPRAFRAMQDHRDRAEISELADFELEAWGAAH
jgi:hypothetical protein